MNKLKIAGLFKTGNIQNNGLRACENFYLTYPYFQAKATWFFNFKKRHFFLIFNRAFLLWRSY